MGVISVRYLLKTKLQYNVIGAYAVNSFSHAAIESTAAVKRLPAPVPVDSTDVKTGSQRTGSSLLNHEYS